MEGGLAGRKGTFTRYVIQPDPPVTKESLKELARQLSKELRDLRVAVVRKPFVQDNTVVLELYGGEQVADRLHEARALPRLEQLLRYAHDEG
jgi:hypothetical protein